MTLSYETLLSATAISVLVMGEGKERVVQEIMAGRRVKPNPLPIVKLLEEARSDTITLFMTTY